MTNGAKEKLDEPDNKEHICFLLYFLCKYLFCVANKKIVKGVFYFSPAPGDRQRWGQKLICSHFLDNSFKSISNILVVVKFI